MTHATSITTTVLLLLAWAMPDKLPLPLFHLLAVLCVASTAESLRLIFREVMKERDGKLD